MQRVPVSSRAELRAWLARHHAQRASVWLVINKKSSGLPHVPYAEIVEEALCFGWIDSRPGKLDPQRSLLLLSPRRPKSVWSRINKQRIARLSAAGLMMPPGLAAVKLAHENGTWSALDEVEALVIPEDLVSAFARHPAARSHWDAFSPSSRKGILQWIASARRPETRARRVAQTAALAARNLRATLDA